MSLMQGRYESGYQPGSKGGLYDLGAWHDNEVVSPDGGWVSIEL